MSHETADFAIVPATHDMLVAMAPRLRANDRREVEALGHTAESGLLSSFQSSLWTRVALVKGRPVCAWGLGVISILGGVGGPWMLSTPLIERIPKIFLRESRRQVAEMRELCPHLTGVVDARYRGAVRWMMWMGFQMSPPFLINGVPFHVFEMR